MRLLLIVFLSFFLNSHYLLAASLNSWFTDKTYRELVVQGRVDNTAFVSKLSSVPTENTASAVINFYDAAQTNIWMSSYYVNNVGKSCEDMSVPPTTANDPITPEEQNIVLDYFSSRFYGPGLSFYTDSLMSAADAARVNSSTFFPLGSGRHALSTCCRQSLSPSIFYCVRVKSDGISDPVVEPPASNLICSLNSQNLNLNFSSTSLNVSQLTKSTNLTIQCTEPGTPINYQLRLTSSKVKNGELDFGNGASAKISLNGIEVNANGAGILLNQLTSRMVSVSATLSGTATGPGVSNANGILLLEAL